jgi:hypothetical protein
MMIVYGRRESVVQLAMATYVCRNCGNTAPHGLLRIDTRLTLFFVPLFRVKSWYILACSSCNARNVLTKEQAQQIQAQYPQAPRPVPELRMPPPQQPYGHN